MNILILVIVAYIALVVTSILGYVSVAKKIESNIEADGLEFERAISDTQAKKKAAAKEKAETTRFSIRTGKPVRKYTISKRWRIARKKRYTKNNA